MQYAAACRFNRWRLWNTEFPLPRRFRGDDGWYLQTQSRDLAACFARGLPSMFRPLQSEGAGNAGRPMRPRAARAEIVVERTRVVRSHRNHPAFPTQWFTAYTVLSPVIGFLATVAGGVASTDLTPASGCQDHTSSPSASSTLVRSTIRVHRIPPRAGDVAQRPSKWDGTANI
jgi:hypothetical protein